VCRIEQLSVMYPSFYGAAAAYMFFKVSYFRELTVVTT
jgi:hypothetical protein